MMRTDDEEKARAESISRIASAARLTVASANTPSGVYYYLIDDFGNPVYRYRPDAVVVNANASSLDEVFSELSAGLTRQAAQESGPVTEDEIQAALKETLLQLYARREPFQFVQYDAFTNTWQDSIIPSDENGEGVMISQTKELMSGCCAVRVLIRPEEEPTVVVRLLRKIANDIEEAGELWATHKDYEQPKEIM